MVKAQSPVFIFSLPRSGSTLLQRVLASHEQIETTAEPWLLLPFIYAMREEGVFTEYSHVGSHIALNDFLKGLPGGKDDFLHVVGGAVNELYCKTMSPEARYFLDKTPRYALICDEIIRAFPNAKFIFLWRNPLAVIASMIKTWGGGRWSLYHYDVDLYKGLPHMLSTFQNCDDKVLAVNYEAFIGNPEREMKRIGAYLELMFDDDALDSFSHVSIDGVMGDPTGRKMYQTVSNEPLGKWKITICNPWRKRWCKNYLNWLGCERLQMMGYSRHQLLAELDSLPFGLKYLLSDLARATGGWLFNTVGAFFLERKWTKLRR